MKTFSGGMGRRLVIVRELRHEPQVLFLVEATMGVDPQIRRDLWDLIVRVNRTRGTAILLTTNYLEEAERLCERVLILSRRAGSRGRTPRWLCGGRSGAMFWNR